MSNSKSKNSFYLWFILATALFLYAVSDIILPFIVSLILAHFLHPIVKKMTKAKISRSYASLIIISLFLLIFASITAFIAPILYQQLTDLVANIPSYIKDFKANTLPDITYVLQKNYPEMFKQVSGKINNASSYILSLTGTILERLLTSGLNALNVLSLIFITPVVSFYILKDWEQITNTLYSLIPTNKVAIVKEQIIKIDETLSGYLRGQIAVCLILACFYVSALYLAGLNFALVIGLTTGFLTFIPFIGPIFGFTVSIIIAYVQFGDFTHIAIILGIFGFAQVLESNFITPKLVGNKVGLHPVWIIFGMLASASLLGFPGVLIALPLTATIGVIIRFIYKEYKNNFSLNN